MNISGSVLPRAHRLAGLCGELSKAARLRLQWFDFYRTHGSNARLTCRHFGISPQTFYRWQRRYDPTALASLEARSHRPRRLRQSTASPALIALVRQWRTQYPRWGKDKLVVLVRQHGLGASTSMVGRILTRLKAQGQLPEPLSTRISARKRPRPRPYAVRKPRDYQPRQPGDLVQVDTLDVRPLPGVILKQFTARDVVSRWDVLGLYTRATATTATGFLDTLLARMPFRVQAIQVDGGSEFQAAFETACQQRGLQLFVLPPRSPKLNGHVERAQRTHTEEFYECYDGPLDLATLRPALQQWEQVYNTVRPHQALGALTPHQFLLHSHHRKEDQVSPK
jgi:transposase InsO family protein